MPNKTQHIGNQNSMKLEKTRAYFIDFTWKDARRQVIVIGLVGVASTFIPIWYMKKRLGDPQKSLEEIALWNTQPTYGT